MWFGSPVVGFVCSVVGRTDSPGLSMHGVSAAMAQNCCSTSLSTQQGHPSCSRGEGRAEVGAQQALNPQVQAGVVWLLLLSSALGLVREVLIL